MDGAAKCLLLAVGAPTCAIAQNPTPGKPGKAKPTSTKAVFGSFIYNKQTTYLWYIPVTECI
jgi:hypothetical protein